MRNIVLVGHPYAGKTSCAHYLATRGYVVIETGRFVEDYAREMGFISPNETLTSEMKSRLAPKAVQSAEDDFFAQRILACVDSQGPYVIVGVRLQSTYDRLGVLQPLLVGLVTDQGIRAERALLRDGLSRDKFDERERLEARYDVNLLLSRCSVIIDNNKHGHANLNAKMEGLLLSPSLLLV
jgi:dephospho-CoA kinase